MRAYSVDLKHMDHAKAAADLMRAGINCYMSAGTAEALDLTSHRLRVVKALEQLTVTIVHRGI